MRPKKLCRRTESQSSRSRTADRVVARETERVLMRCVLKTHGLCAGRSVAQCASSSGSRAINSSLILLDIVNSVYRSQWPAVVSPPSPPPLIMNLQGQRRS